MKVAHYYYNEYGRRFCDYLPRNFLMMDNFCDDSVDVIYCSAITKLKEALLAKAKYKKPLICWVWDIPAEIGRNVDYVIAGLKECDYVISASRYTQDVLATYGIASEQMYFYIDMPIKHQFMPAVDQIIQVSRYVPHKRFEVAIEAVGDLPLYMIGVSKDEQYFKSLPEKVNLFYQFNIPKYQVINHIYHSTILVSPSIFEGWGLSPMEAIACGTPIILNDLPVFREVWDDVAIYHKQDDVEDLRGKIQELLSSKTRQKNMVSEGQKLIEDFTPQKFAKRWINLF